MMENTLTSFFLQHIKTTELNKEVFFTKEDDEYIPFKTGDLLRQVFLMAKFLQEVQLNDGDKVAILSESRVEWVVADFACMFSKLVSIPIYTSLSLSQIKYILKNSNSKVCFVSNSLMLEKILNVIDKFPNIRKIIIFQEQDLSQYKNESIINFTNIVSTKIKISEDEMVTYLKGLSLDVTPSDLLTIIYTSGTSGIPKGVMLSHNNIYSNIRACQKVLPINENDVFLSYLPYSHVFERTAGYYLPFFCGSKIYYAQNIDTIARQLPEIKPTFVITVPRLMDKIYNKLLKSGEDMKEDFKKRLFLWAVKIAHDEAVSKKSITWKIADKLVYGKIREKTGGRIRYFVSGGGALNKIIGKFFDKIGVTVLEGYGMTETSPVICVNRPEKNKYGTVGKPIPGVNIKLSQENEIMVQGELVMLGYYNDEKTTLETIDDGWLHTGDIGELDGDNYLKITDRKKSLIKSSGGKYIAPTHIEELISVLSYVEYVVIIGNERMYISALIVPDKNELESLARKNGLTINPDSHLYSNSDLLKIIQKDIDNLQKDLAGYERVRKFSLLEKPFTIESGELTPTMKVKRKFVEEKYKDVIESMYLRM